MHIITSGPAVMQPRDTRTFHPTPPLRTTLAEINALATWEAGWNGYDAPSIQLAAIALVVRWLDAFYDVVTHAAMPWDAPNVTGGSEGEVVLEWWHGTKKLTIYIAPARIDYVKVWGTDIDHEMEDGELTTYSVFLSLWEWLHQ